MTEESKALIAAPSWMQADAKATDDQLKNVNIASRIHLCQAKSPEVEDLEIAKSGEFFVRGANKNLGASFDAFVVGYDMHYIRWGNAKLGDPQNLDGKILWYGWPEMMTVSQQADCRWIDGVDGGKSIAPKAKETHSFALMLRKKDGSLDSELMVYSMDRACARVGLDLAKALRAMARKNYPLFAVPVRFESAKEKNDKGDIYQAPRCKLLEPLTEKDKAAYMILRDANIHFMKDVESAKEAARKQLAAGNDASSNSGRGDMPSQEEIDAYEAQKAREQFSKPSTGKFIPGKAPEGDSEPPF